MLRWASVLGAGVLAAGVGAAIAARLDAADSGAARDIKAQFARQVERIKSLDVAYKLETTSNLSPEKLRAIPEYSNQLFLPQDQWHVAFKGEKRYVQQIQPERIKYLAPVDEYGLFAPPEPAADAPPLIKENQKDLRKQYDRAIAAMKAQEARGVRIPKRDPTVRDRSEQDVTRGFNGKTLWVRKPTSPKAYRYETWSGGSRPNFFQVAAYLGAVGLHVPDPKGGEDVRSAQAIFQVAQWINDHPYELEPKTEVVDGSTCVILKGSLNSILQPGTYPGNLTDRIWLDRDHGMALRKREMARDRNLLTRWTNTNLKEVDPGLWFPMTTRMEQFSVRPMPDLGDKPIMVEEIHVQSLSVNQVPDERFDMIPQPGDTIDDLRGRF
jgi:hypothetical protein